MTSSPISSPVTGTTAAPADPLLASLALWRKSVEAELKGAPFDKKLVARTFEGIALQPLYTRASLPAGASDARPGEAPFLRGVRPLGYKERTWEIAQEHALRAPVLFNSAVMADLARGQDSVVLTPCAAARAGFDSGENAADLAGDTGVAIASRRELTMALAGVDLGAVSVHVHAGADALPLAAIYLGLARDGGADWSKLTGSVTADPLGEWVEAGRLAASLGALYDSLAGWTTWSASHTPKLHTIGVNAVQWAEAGGTAVQELAFALAGAAEYLRALRDRDVPVALAGGRMRFRFAVGPQFFLEIAKFRAFRPLWARVLEAFGAPAHLAAQTAVHAATARWNKTMLDPHVNMLRATTEALSAVLGGCDSLHIGPFDETAGTSNEFSRRIACNVHTLLAEEFGFTQTADPGGGSWYLESLTDELARRAWVQFQAIEGRGGLAAALREGYPQQLVTKAAAEKAEAVAKRRLGLVGTNLFPNLKEKSLAPPTPASASRNDRNHDGRHLAAMLPAEAKWPARFEAALAAAASGATIGQLARLTRPIASSEWVIVSLKPWRAAAAIEELRAAADAFARRTGARPRVFLARMGPAAQHKARADFSAGFFAVGGFEVTGKDTFDLPEAAAQAAAASGAPVAVLCSTDETYPILVPAFARAAKAARRDLQVVLAGLPADPAVVAAFRDSGVDEFIHLRASVTDILRTLLTKMGAIA
jgi:methylmalonyl-CoA mutase